MSTPQLLVRAEVAHRWNWLTHWYKDLAFLQTLNGMDGCIKRPQSRLLLYVCNEYTTHSHLRWDGLLVYFADFAKKTFLTWSLSMASGTHTERYLQASAKRLLGPCDMQTYTSVLLRSFCVPKSPAKDRWGKGGHSRTPTMWLRQVDQALGDAAKIPSPRLTSHQQHHAHHNKYFAGGNRWLAHSEIAISSNSEYVMSMIFVCSWIYIIDHDNWKLQRLQGYIEA